MPSKSPSVALGAAAYAVLSIALAFLILRGGPSLQAAAGCFGCLVILIGPMLAVWHYTSTFNQTLLPGEGASLGAATGAIGALVSGALSQILIALNVLPDAAETMAIQRQKMIEQGLDPAQIDSAMSMAERFSGLSSNPLLGLVVGVAFGALLGALAGLLAAALFKKGGSAPSAAV